LKEGMNLEQILSKT